MSNLESVQATYNLLSTSTALSSIVGTRIYPQRAPNNAFPTCVIYTEISVTPYGIVQGFAKNESARMQIDCYGATQQEAGAISVAVRNAMQPTLPGTFGGVNVSTIELDGRISNIDDNAGDEGYYRITMDFLIYYKRN